MDCSKTINFFSELRRLCASRDGCVAMPFGLGMMIGKFQTKKNWVLI